MKKNFLYISSLAISSLLAFSACSDETGADVNHGKSPVELSVGLAGETFTTRAITELPVDAQLSTLPTGTTLYMVMKSEAQGKDTKWTMTKAVTGEATNNISPVNFTESGTIRYWDDVYARDAAVSVYGICTPGGTPNAPTIGGKSTYTHTETPTTGAWSTDANGLTISNWTVSADQANLSAETFADQDLCYSNNIASYNSTDNRMQFAGGKFDKGNLVFYHALTKVTVNMIAGKGFEVGGGKTAFQSPATATLHNFNTKGDFELTAGVVSNQTEEEADITTFLTNDDKSGTEEVVTRSAIVMPGRTLAATDKILTVDGDGNPYDVTAAQLVDVMPDGAKTMLQGTEYIINVRINKTGIKVTATIKAWDTVEGTNYSPFINITQSYGDSGDNFAKGFSLYLSQGAGVDASLEDDFAKGTDVTYNDSKYTLDSPLYWPNHQKHYLFRGIWPLVAESGTDKTPSAQVNDNSISVANCAYEGGKYPSDLMLGYPRKAGEKCQAHNKDVATCGICATEGSIAMNFQYVMSRVEVNLSTNTDPDAKNAVVFDEKTKVEIVNGYKEGYILFKDGTSDFTGKSTADYAMNKVGDSNVKFHDAIIPQSLGDGDGKLMFRITVTDTDGKEDKYETVLGIKDIEVTPAGGAKGYISAWAPGVYYIYNLYITKTGIKVTATIKDWVEVKNDDPYHIWM